MVSDIHGALQGVAFALLVLFFAFGAVKGCVSLSDFKRPETALRILIRFVLAKGAVTYSMEFMEAITEIVQGIVSVMMESISPLTSSPELPQEIISAIEECSFLESIPLWALSLIGSVVMFVLSIILVLTVYGRFFRLYMYTAIAPLPLSSFAGDSTSGIGIAFIKSYAGVCMEGAIIVLACIIFSSFTVSVPELGDQSAAVLVYKYIGQIIFNMLILVTCVKASDRIVHDMCGI